jgi:hypothetical protein
LRPDFGSGEDWNTDLEGAATEVALLDWMEPEAWEGIKNNTVCDVTFTWLDPTPRWY